MTEIKTDPLVTEIIARNDKFRAGMAAARATYLTESQRMQLESDKLRQRIERNSGAIGGNLKALSGSLAAYFSGRELIGIIDGFTAFQNSLKVAGVAGADLQAVQDRLFASAQRYGVEIGTLGGLFATLTNASKELGASQEDIFKLTDVVSASLKVSGQSATEASGALLQLGQSLRGGRIQAEEYNSLLDGAYPLLEAAAAGSDRWGGSVAKLTADVKAGKVASVDFFNAILAGSGEVIKRAELSTVSLSSAFTQLNNALVVYVGSAAQSSGAQAALAQGIQTIANNLDVLIPAFATIAAAMGVRYVASAGAAALATLRADAALIGLTSRAEVAGFAMGKLAGALAFNGVILALTVALGGFAAESARTSTLVQQANQQYDEMSKRLSDAAGVAGSAGDGARGVGAGAAAAEPQVRSFAGAVGELARQLYDQAKAARAAKVEMLSKRLEDSKSAELELGKRTAGGRADSMKDLRRGDFLNNISIWGRAATGGVRSLLSGGRTDREAMTAYTKQVSVSLALRRQLKDAQSAPLETFVPTPAPTPAPAPTGGGRTGAGTAGGGANSAAADAKQRREEQQRIEEQIANARIAYLQELATTTRNAAERARLEVQAIDATRAANEKELRNTEGLSDAQRAKLVELNNQVAGLRAQQVMDQEAERLRRQQFDIASQALRDEEGLLQAQARIADTAAERRAIDERRLAIAYDLEKAAIAEELAQAQVAEDAQRIAAARARLAELEERASVERESVRRDNEGPLARYRRGLDDPATDVQNAVAQKLQDVDDAIADAAADTLGVKDPFLRQLLQVFLQQNVLKPLYDAVSQSGGGGGGLLGSLLSIGASVLGGGSGGSTASFGKSIEIGNILGRASGGYVPPRGLVRVNEGGPGVELLRMGGQGGTVIPLGQADRVARPAQPMVLHQTINVDGRNSVTPAGFARQILDEANRNASVAAARMGQAVIKGVPARMAQYQGDGT